jgi:hypothetical protein
MFEWIAQLLGQLIDVPRGNFTELDREYCPNLLQGFSIHPKSVIVDPSYPKHFK